MSWKNLLGAGILLIASAQVASMTSNPSDSCTVEGAQYFPASGGEAAICQRFSDEFHAAMGEGSVAGDYTFTIRIGKSGTIDANVTKDAGSNPREYPGVSVDVMDRGIDYRDLANLAQASARIVKMNQSGA